MAEAELRGGSFGLQQHPTIEYRTNSVAEFDARWCIELGRASKRGCNALRQGRICPLYLGRRLYLQEQNEHPSERRKVQ
jgi:hypothetical protein